MAKLLKPVTSEEVLKQQSFVLKTFSAICRKGNISKSIFVVNWAKINEAIIRAYRREEFYNVYHNSRMSEIKLMSVLAFWIMKYKPFYSKEINKSQVSENINEYIAINLILMMVSITRQKNNINRNITITHEGYKQLVYRFKNWDLSKESLMTLADFMYYYDGLNIDNLDTGESKYGRV